MDDFTVFFSFLMAILTLVVIVHFFKISNNVKRIRRFSVGNLESLSNSAKYEAFGYLNKAKEAYEDFIWANILRIHENNSWNADSKKREYGKLKKLHESKLIELGSSWPKLDSNNYPGFE